MIGQMLSPRGLPPGLDRGQARRALEDLRDLAWQLVIDEPDGAVTLDKLHRLARGFMGLGAALDRIAPDEDDAARREAWAGRLARAGWRLGLAAVRRWEGALSDDEADWIGDEEWR